MDKPAETEAPRTFSSESEVIEAFGQRMGAGGRSRVDRTKRTIARGIRRDCYGWEVQVSFRGKIVSKRFPSDYSVESMKAWRVEAKNRLMADGSIKSTCAALIIEESRHLRPSPEGWCYVYFIQDGNAVKVGRATDPRRRLEELQTAHRNKLALIAAIPAHRALELAIHARFKHLATGREWFLLEPELVRFIERLKSGENPVAVLWETLAIYFAPEPENDSKVIEASKLRRQK